MVLTEIDPSNGMLELLVYYQVPDSKRDEVKRKLDIFLRNQMAFTENLLIHYLN